MLLAATVLTVLFVTVECRSQTLNWKVVGAHRTAPLKIHPSGKVGFELLGGDRTGITFRNRLNDQQVTENRIRENGSGLALCDVDGDGLTDIYFCRLDGPNALYRNEGNWKFTDVTARSVRGGRLAVYRNDAGKRFVELIDPPITTPLARDLTSVLG